MGPRNLPQEQPQQLFQDAAQDVQAQKAQAELEATVLRFWDTVRKSADVIVTLRQENAVLQAQVAVLRKSEAELQAQAGRGLSEAPLADPSPLAAPVTAPIAAAVTAPEFSATDVEAMEALIAKARETEMKAHETEMRAHEAEVRGLRTNIDRLEDELNRLQNELNEAQAQLIDHSTISAQLSQVRVELDARSKLLLELQVNLEEQRDARQLDQRQFDQRQLDIFGTVPQMNAFGTAPQRGMAPAEMLALASRLDVLSGRISSLFGIS